MSQSYYYFRYNVTMSLVEMICAAATKTGGWYHGPGYHNSWHSLPAPTGDSAQQGNVDWSNFLEPLMVKHFGIFLALYLKNICFVAVIFTNDHKILIA